MNTDEYRALVEAGPAVVMVAKEDMLKLLDKVKAAEEWAAFGKRAYATMHGSASQLRDVIERLNFRLSQEPHL